MKKYTSHNGSDQSALNPKGRGRIKWGFGCLSSLASLMLLSSTATGAVIIQDDIDDGSGGNADLSQLAGTFGPATYDESPAVADDSYHYPGGNNAQFTWSPALTGEYIVYVSWAAGGHTTDANYYFDADGAGGGAEILPAAGDGINQTLLADQVTLHPDPQNWSGFYELGTFDLTPSSWFRVQDQNVGFLTTGVWQFEAVVPEPSSMALLLVGGALAAASRRRRK